MFIFITTFYNSLAQSNGYTKEEMKVAWETRKIFGLKPLTSDDSSDSQDDDDLRISCTAVRIPTLRAHSEAITVETDLVITPEAAR